MLTREGLRRISINLRQFRQVLGNRATFEPKFQTVRAMSTVKSDLDLRGVFPPIVTPFNGNEDISWEKLEQNMNMWNQIDFKGYVVQGSNGEYVFMTPEERVELVKRVKELAAPGRTVIAGSGCESTRDTIAMTKKMAAAGADAVMVVTPSYFKSLMNAAALEHHYTKLADESPVPVILYSVPANTSIDLPAEVVIKLSFHPNIIGIKDSAGDITKLGTMCHKSEKGFQVLAGSASFMYAAMTVGCVGAVAASANVLGREVCELYKLTTEGRLDEARVLQHLLIGPNTAVTKTFGVPGVKAAMDWYGFYGGPVRAPLQPINTADLERLKNTFTSDDFTPQ